MYACAKYLHGDFLPFGDDFTEWFKEPIELFC